jgi:arylsulfatase A-like enzyme
MHPNVLLIVLDTARADAFEPYGAAAGETPTVAQLASRGGAVEHVSATACWTLPSHVSMFSGALPRAVGLGDAPTPHSARRGVEALTDRLLPEVLRRNGYRTAAASTNLWISEASGFATGFDDFRSLHGDRQERMVATGRQGRLRWIREAVRAQADDGARDAGEVLRRWIDDWSGEPCLWFVNLVECHSPYLPPRPYNDLSPLALARAAEEARRHLTLGAIWRTCLDEFDVPEAALQRMRHLYARAIRYMDDWLASILEALDAKRILDETLVVVTSDHGENFGEGGLLAHALSLDDRLLRVPFVAAGPGSESLAGIRSLAQLPGLLADATGIDSHPWAPDTLPAGAALAQFEPPGGVGNPTVAAEVATWGLDAAAVARFSTPVLAATDGRTKALRRGEYLEMFDLASDPLELSPLRPNTEQPVPAALLDALEHPATTIAPSALTTKAAPVPADEMADLERRMQMLGYL